jgi:hypothetical protein
VFRYNAAARGRFDAVEALGLALRVDDIPLADPEIELMCRRQFTSGLW